MELLSVQHISKTYGSGEAAMHALRDVSFSVSKGEFVAVVGESGSGKSTLLNMIGGIDEPSAGKVFIDGKDIFAMRERNLTIFRRRNIGFIFQSFNLIPELTVEQNIFFPFSWITKNQMSPISRSCSPCWVSASDVIICRASFPADSSNAWPSVAH